MYGHLTMAPSLSVSEGRVGGPEKDNLGDGTSRTEIGPRESSAPPVSSVTPPASLKYKLVQQIGIINAYVAQGAFAEIIGPTLQDLMDMFGVTYEVIAEGLAVKAAGFAVGAVIGCILQDILHRRPALLVGIGLLFSALGMILIPYSPSALIFRIVIFLPGMGRGIMTVGGVVQTMDIWQEKAAGPMQSLYFAFDLGAILMTETVRPFLSTSIQANESNMSANMTAASVNSTTAAVNSSMLGIMMETPPTPSSSARIVYPFVIVAVYTVVAALVMFALHCYDSRQLTQTEKRTPCEQELTCPMCSVAFVRTGVITLGASLYCFHSNGGEKNFMTYLLSYAFESAVHFTKNQATTLVAVVRFAMFFGRFCGIFVAHFLRIQYLIVVSVILLIIAFSCLSWLPQISTVVLWVIAVIAGMFIGIQYAAGMTLANLFVRTNSLVTMIWFMGASLGQLSYEYTTGYLFDKYGVHTLSYIMLVYAVSLMCVFILIQTVAKFHTNRFSKADTD